ncbi:Phage protein [Staphylococcus equorum subsp. equorum]|uniref:hypothetical protein n=1 Tax=Staphylococcus equorum TaxID=246432 RepID=UPI000623F772|nr:hypothetical protein [Staphylococcus equorum]KKI52935.1 Phage protein [Staphylococcus equorum subsp. equorum]
MKIKTKKQLNLPQLIEWGFENDITNKEYVCNEHKAKSVIFNLSGWAEFSDEFSYNPHDTFTVEVGEEITEDTVIPRLVVRHGDTGFTLYENDYINNEFPLDGVQAFYILNDDLTMILIWRDGKLVE